MLSRVMALEVTQEVIGCLRCYGTVQGDAESFRRTRKYRCLQRRRDFGTEKDVYTVAI